MMKSSGDDTEFEIDLGAMYDFNYIQLDSAIIENQFVNFYESWNEDFRTMNVVIAGQTYSCFIDQYCEDFDTLIAFFNANNGSGGTVVMQNVGVVGLYRQILACRFLRNGAQVNSTLQGGAWSKLGLQTGVIRQDHSGLRSYDLGQSPTILVGFENIPNSFKSKYGNFSFQIANNAAFGGRIIYASAFDTSCQHIKLPYIVSVNRLKMTLYNCDLKKLLTGKQGNQIADNNNGIECIFVFTIKRAP